MENDPRCICEAKPLKVLLVKIEGEWRLPTATVRPAESTDSAAYRALVEQTAIDLRHMGQIVKETVAKEYIENREVATSWFPNCLKLRVCDQATMTPPVSVTNWMITWNLHDFVKTYPQVTWKRKPGGKYADSRVQEVQWFDFDKLPRSTMNPDDWMAPPAPRLSGNGAVAPATR